MLPDGRLDRRLAPTRTLTQAIVIVMIAAVWAHAAAHASAPAGAVPASGQAGIAQVWVGHAYMPIAGSGMLERHLAPPRTAVPSTPTRGPSPTPTDTATPTATRTPTATPTPTPKPLDAQETDPALTFTGAWRRVTDARASGDAYNVSATSGDKVEVTFAGDHIVLYRMVAPDGGLASVAIDGQSEPYGDLKFYFSERRYQVPAVFDNLKPGTHTLTLTIGDDRPTGSSGKNVYIDALKAPDTTITSNDLQGEALSYTNRLRDLVGLPRIRLDRGINLAAQSHAEYAARNTSAGHGETPGTPGFIGARSWDRLAYFGYASFHNEVISWATENDPTYAIDIWVGSVYHRMPFMDHKSTDIGYGQAKGAQFTTAVVDVGDRDHVPPRARVIATYPDDGQTGIPISWRHNTEAPDPLPGQPAEVGYPLSLHIAQPAAAPRAAVPWAWDDLGGGSRLAAPSAWRLGSAKLTDSAGREVSSYVLDQATDPAKYIPADVVFLMARTKMAPNSRYTMRITGQDSRDQPFDVTWSFTTGTGSRVDTPGMVGNPTTME